MTHRLIVIGAGGHAKVVISAARAAGWRVTGVFDDDPAKIGSELLGVPILGPIGDIAAGGIRTAVVALGSNRVRARFTRTLDLEWTAIVDPAATVRDGVEVAPGAVVLAGAVVQPETVVGEHAIVNTGATVDHDCVIGAFAHVAPGAHLAGHVTVSEGGLVGIGAAVIDGCSIGAWAVLGAGAVAVADVQAGRIAVGVPARTTPQ